MNKRGEATRKHIKEQAYILFAEKGFKEVSMKDVCEAAGLSRGGLYCHYESTNQIFKEIIDDFMQNQEDEFCTKIEQNLSAVSILDDVLERYKIEMADSQSSLSLAIYEYFSNKELAEQKNLLNEQYHLSEKSWRNLIQYGIDTKEFREVDVKAVFDLIVFSYQGVRMYSKIMPIDKEIPERITSQIRRILVRSDENGNNF